MPKSYYLSFGVPDLMRRAYSMLELQKQGYRTGANAGLFAAIAVEAFLSDFKLMCEMTTRSGDPVEVSAAADLLGEMERSRHPIRTKYSLLYYVLSHSQIPKGDPPYQDFDLLIDARDALAHFKSIAVEQVGGGNDYAYPIQKLVQRLAIRKLISRDLNRTPTECQIRL